MRNALVALFTGLLVGAPRAALACPVCFGQNDSPLAIATNMGIVAMLVVVAGVLGAFASFFIYLMRRGKLVTAQEGPGEVGHHTRSESDPREGTAQC
ncbi:MAG: hypothetical protein DMF95_02240 [Acidobacteria bacterium]|nr:MAG: hypothetical protein DMF96_08020 [Acidobacteriota bacterium]PYR20587.1 MAG: hypothetical protein DMF94_11255 [Acidobacteriota bacterium]PYR53892.1 MAG: hypothetical protein DMF95_02240 [Acidobacteriota bacterium]